MPDAVGVTSAGRPSVSVVIPTCGNRTGLERTLTSVLATGYEALEVVVVDNRPPAPAIRQLVEEGFVGSAVRYVAEERPGASWARNAGLQAVTGDIVAFADDDVVVDPAWIDCAIAAFERVDDAACVTGRILPLSLETVPQQYFDQLSVFDKGAHQRVFRLAESRASEPLFPYVPGHMGSGANIFLRRHVAEAMGGFDPLLGPGTPTVGGEDLDLFIRLAQSGHAIVYDPAVLLWHEHPRGRRGLRVHAYHYGVGLTAMLAKQMVRGPARLRLLRAVPGGLRYELDPRSRKNANKSSDYPPSLDRLERLGMLVGPGAYLLSLAKSAFRRVADG
jgi:GT2 family glycosyltransferase